jgi:DNA-binding SARP family transcriptional activator
VQIRLLGPLEVRDGERVIPLPRRQQRALLAALVLRVGQVVSTDRLIADLWGERAPAAAASSLQNTVAALRKTLGRDVIVTQPPGYRLAVEPACVDAYRFERLLAQARGEEPARRAGLLREALALCRGPALDGLEGEFARLEARRLEELRLDALEDRVDADLALGRHAVLVGELETHVATNPLRERPQRQLALAFYRCGRQGEALGVCRAFRLAQRDELGLDPSSAMRELERKILRQDPELDLPAEVEPVAAVRASERRLVSVLAAVPPAGEDPEQMQRRLNELLARVRAVLDRYDGVLERFGPEGLVAVFGAETPRDDDALRAFRAARELGLPAGIATGESVGGVGNVVTRAAELARQGGLEMDERTRTLVEHEPRLDAPLVGRLEELARLRVEFDAAKSERCCRVVTVLGEPGIGKTRLARELTTTLAGEATTLVGRCFSYAKGQTFLPLVDAFQQLDLAAALGDSAEGELATTRLVALARPQEADTLGETYWAVRRLLEALARGRPVLLILDDVHWAEPALLDLFDYLVGRITEAPVLVVLLARPELQWLGGEQLQLGPLTPDETRQLVAGLADLDPGTQDGVVALADGNALYAEQLAAFAAEHGAGLPATLEAVLAGRIGQLAASERQVIQRAAVAGREFTRSVVAALSDQPIDVALSSLSRRNLIHPTAIAEPGDDGYRFHHVLLRDAAYATLTKAERASLHERVADWLDRDRDGDDALTGYHLEQAALLRRELGDNADELAAHAGERLGRAGMHVRRTKDLATAIGLLQRAVALLPATESRALFRHEYSAALRQNDRPEEAADALARALSDAIEAGSRTIRARVECQRAITRLLAGDFPLDRAEDMIAKQIPVLRAAADPGGLASAEIGLCAVHWFACRYDELAAAAARAKMLYRGSGLISSGVAAGYQAELLYFGATPVAAAIESCAALLDWSPNQATRALTTAVMGGLQALAGNITDAQLLIAHARSLYEEIGFETALLLAWTALFVEVEAMAGNRDAAKAAARATVERLRATGDFAHASARALQLADLLLDEDDTDEADHYVRMAEEKALEGHVFLQFRRRSARARILARMQKTPEAIALAREAVAIATPTDALLDRARAHFALAEALELAGQTKHARAEMTAGRKLLRQKGATALLNRHRTPMLTAPISR